MLLSIMTASVAYVHDHEHHAQVSLDATEATPTSAYPGLDTAISLAAPGVTLTVVHMRVPEHHAAVCADTVGTTLTFVY